MHVCLQVPKQAWPHKVEPARLQAVIIDLMASDLAALPGGDGRKVAWKLCTQVRTPELACMHCGSLCKGPLSTAPGVTDSVNEQIKWILTITFFLP